MAELQVGRDGGRHDEDGRGDGRLGEAQDEPAGRLVDGEEDAADGVLLFRVVAAHRQLVEDPRQPARAEVDEVHPREEHPKGGIEGERQHRGDGQGQVLGPGQGCEEPTLLVHEGEDGQEGDGDDEEREEDRGPDLEQRLEAHLVEVAHPPSVLPELELLVGVLHLDDGAVHEDADGDGDARRGT